MSPQDCQQSRSRDRLHHVAIAVDDVADVLEWYRKRFSCEVLYQDETWALIGFANVQLALVVPGQHPPHIGFEHPEARAFGDLAPHRDGSRSVYIEDPAGNTVELLEPGSDRGLVN